MNPIVLAGLFVIATWTGYNVIRSVPSLLHTPLMSGMNALSGVTVLGALLATASAVGSGNQVLGAIGVALATTNVVGGFFVTHRILKMFKSDVDSDTDDSNE